MKYFNKRGAVTALSALSILISPTLTMGSAFQIWEQDVTSIANFHAGYAALADNASIAFYNPAGIIRIKDQQAVLSLVSVVPDFKYKGWIGINTVEDSILMRVKAQGGVFIFVPALHYVAPICDWIGFGFSVFVPFGLKTDYGHDSIIRYAATKTGITVVDISPSLGIQVTQRASFGVGLDIQRIEVEFDQMGVLGDREIIAKKTTDTASINKVNNTGYGYHLGALYQFTPDARIGVSYHSKVTHHLKGNSVFKGFLADNSDYGRAFSSRASTKIRLPSYTALSYYHRFHPCFALMGTAIFTNWEVFNKVILKNMAGILDGDPSKKIKVVITEKYKNTWSGSLGLDYYATDHLVLRGGFGYDKAPVRKSYRHVQLPDNNRFALALGGHYQATCGIGFDLGWSHFFVHKAHLNPPPQVTGDQAVITKGHVKGGADVYGAQITWDIP